MGKLLVGYCVRLDGWEVDGNVCVYMCALQLASISVVERGREEILRHVASHRSHDF